MFSQLTPRALARAPFRVAVSAGTAMALAAAAGFLSLPHPSEPASSEVSTDVAATLPVAATLDAAPAKPADLNCLAKAVYYEARGESADGQAAVAQVVINRTHRPTYPASVCGVVFQGVDRGGCQFSFACNGAMHRPLEPVAWTRARRVASDALRGHVMRAVGQAVSFHVAPFGENRRGSIARIGGHVFFEPGRERLLHHVRSAQEVAEVAPSVENQVVDVSAVVAGLDASD